MREKLIELLKDTRANAAWHRWGLEESADHLIANGVTLDNQVSNSKWIPVSERLPEDIGTYLIVVKSKYPFDRDYSYETDVAMYRWDGKGRLDGCWDAFADWGDGEEYIHVTHWMPLPEPPEGE